MKGLFHELLDLIEHVTGLAVPADPTQQPTPADRIASLRDQVDALDASPPAEATAAEPAEDPRDAEIAALKAKVAALEAPAAAPTPAPAAAPAEASAEAPA